MSDLVPTVVWRHGREGERRRIHLRDVASSATLCGILAHRASISAEPDCAKCIRLGQS